MLAFWNKFFDISHSQYAVEYINKMVFPNCSFDSWTSCYHAELQQLFLEAQQKQSEGLTYVSHDEFNAP